MAPDVNVETIATEARVTRATVYKYFENKDKLFREAITAIALNTSSDIHVQAQADLYETLLQFARAFRDNSLSEVSTKLYLLSLEAVREWPDLTAYVFELNTGRMLGELAAYLRGQMDAGRITAMDPYLAAEWFMSASRGLSMGTQRSPWRMKSSPRRVSTVRRRIS